MDKLEKKLDRDRFYLVYEQLIDQTDNRVTLQNRQANQRLKDTLALFEYLRGEDEYNPLIEWFTDLQPIKP